MGGGFEFKARRGKLQATCCGDIYLFLLRKSDNLEQDILMAEVNFRNLTGRLEGADWCVFRLPCGIPVDPSR